MIKITVYDNDWFIARVKERRPKDYDEYKFIDEYKNSHTYIKAIHNVCGEEINILPNSFISRGSRCPKCSRKSVAEKQMKSLEEIQSELPEGLYLTDEYLGMHRRVELHCTKCESTYENTPSNILKAGNCTRCLGRHERTLEDVKEEIMEWSGGEYEVTSTKWVNTHTPIKVKHLECEEVYEVTRSNFKKGRRCPFCSSSIGEKMTDRVLTDLGIEFKPQKSFSGLVRKNPLTYDFYLPKHKVLIEYQGEQHYHPVKHFGGQETFEVQKEIDAIKAEYAEENGYTLVEIPYTKRTYEEIKEHLQTTNLISLIVTH